jgi:small subunit ribosomal protein S2
MPATIIIMDLRNFHFMVQEAFLLQIPIVAIVDTNNTLQALSYPIPGNDDSFAAMKLYYYVLAKAIVAGKQLQKYRFHNQAILRKVSGDLGI